jgi:hypothetical protein
MSVILSLTIYFFQKNFLYKEIDSNLETTLETSKKILLHEVTENVDDVDRRTLQEHLTPLLPSIAFLNKKGEVVIEKPSNTTNPISAPINILPKVIPNTTFTVSTISGTSNKYYRVLSGSVIYDKAQFNRQIVVSLPLDSTYEYLGNLQFICVGIIIGLPILGISIGSFLSTTLAKKNTSTHTTTFRSNKSLNNDSDKIFSTDSENKILDNKTSNTSNLKIANDSIANNNYHSTITINTENTSSIQIGRFNLHDDEIENLAGRVVDNKYLLEKVIGHGGYGVVYEAKHIELNNKVAIKIFLPSHIKTKSDNLKRFRLEGISACRVNHPNAISIFDLGISDEGIAYLVMELLSGHSVLDEIKNNKTFSVERCLDIIIPVCEVLAEAHQQGIIHRDIKPDNIFLHQVDNKEVVKLIDFGIAKLLDKEEEFNVKTKTGHIIGTPIYMSPERLKNNDYGGQSDIYSLGILMYEMLVGFPPFDSNTMSVAEVIVKHLMDEPEELRQIDPNIPIGVEKMVLQALAKDTSNRPSAIEFLNMAKKERWLLKQP